MKSLLAIPVLIFAHTAPLHAQSGCPANTFKGVHLSGVAWDVVATDGGTVLISGIGHNGKARGRATFECRDGIFTLELRQMDNNLKYDCTGNIEDGFLDGDMSCVNADNRGQVIGSIRGHDARFE
ncbi:MAG: hypothetical protein AAF636_26740 [Pseudomonadota bacterium]